ISDPHASSQVAQADRMKGGVTARIWTQPTIRGPRCRILLLARVNGFVSYGFICVSGQSADNVGAGAGHTQASPTEMGFSIDQELQSEITIADESPRTATRVYRTGSAVEVGRSHKLGARRELSFDPYTNSGVERGGGVHFLYGVSPDFVKSLR